MLVFRGVPPKKFNLKPAMPYVFNEEVTLSAMCCAAEKGNAWSQLLAMLQRAQHRWLSWGFDKHRSQVYDGIYIDIYI